MSTFTSEPSLWTVGFVAFAAVLMITSGIFWFIEGLAAVLEDEFFVVAPGYAFEMDLTTWGWVHMIGGAVLAVSGFFIFTGNLLARLVGIGVAVLAATINFFYIPYYPIWSLVIIAVSVVIIWALTVYGRDIAAP
jgi:hypothetical protein